jgi:hypothetical protein
MYQINIIVGRTRHTLTDLTRFATRAVKRFNLKKQSLRLSPSELEKLNDATIRETPKEEVARRMEEFKKLRG